MICFQQHLPTLEAFSGKAEEFEAWNFSLFDAAIAYGHSDPAGLGMLGFLASDAEYLAAPRTHGAAAVF